MAWRGRAGTRDDPGVTTTGSGWVACRWRGAPNGHTSSLILSSHSRNTVLLRNFIL